MSYFPCSILEEGAVVVFEAIVECRPASSKHRTLFNKQGHARGHERECTTNQHAFVFGAGKQGWYIHACSSHIHGREHHIIIYFTSTTKRSMSLLEFTTTMDSSNCEEPPAKKYRYSSERHPFRIFEDFDLDDLDDDDDADDSLLVGHHFAEVSRISTFTATVSAERRHPARKARMDEHHHQQQQHQVTAPEECP